MNLKDCNNPQTVFLTTTPEVVKTVEQIVDEMPHCEEFSIAYETESDIECQREELKQLIEKAKTKASKVYLHKMGVARGESIESLTESFNVMYQHWLWVGAYNEKTKERPFAAWEVVA